MSPPDPKACVVHRIHRDLRRVMISGPAEAAPAAWVANLRRLHPPLQRRTPLELLTEARTHAGIDLGILEGREARRLVQALEPHGFEVLVEDASTTTHFPITPEGGVIIEDPKENEAFCAQLIQKDAALVHVEA